MNAESAIQRFKTLYELFPDFVCTLDPRGIIIECNDRALNFFGYKKEEAIGRSCLEFIRSDYREKTLEGLERVKKEGIGRGTELVFIRRDGTTFHGLARGARIDDESNQLAGFLVSIKDITLLHDSILEGHERETIIREKLEEIIKVQTAKDNLLSSMRSDMLNSLTPLNVYIEILLAEHLGPLLSHQHKALEQAKICTQQCIQQISTLSDLQSIDLVEIKAEHSDITDKKSITVKLDPLNINRLQVYANLENKTPEELLDDVIFNYFSWNIKSTDAGFVHLPKYVIMKIFSCLTDKEIEEIATTFAKEKLKIILEETHGDSNIDAFLTFLKKRSVTSGFEYLQHNDGKTLKISIIHKMGLKWSLFFMTTWDYLLHDLGYPTNSKHSEDFINIIIHLSKDNDME